MRPLAYATSPTRPPGAAHAPAAQPRPPAAARRLGARHAPADLPLPVCERAGRALTRWVLRWFFGVRHVHTHRIPRRGPVILVANHPTIFDPFTVAFGTKRWVTWLAFQDALAWPVAGQVMRLYRAIPLDIERPSHRSLRACYATLARDRVLGLFFEGERSFGPGLNAPLKVGAARMALRTGATLVPVSVAGGRRCWPRERPWPTPGKIVVRYHPPIDPRRFRPDLPLRARAEALTATLAEVIGGALPPDGGHRVLPPPRRPRTT